MEEDSQGGDPVGSRGGGSGARLPGRAHGGDGRRAGVLRRPARHGGRGSQDDGHGMFPPHASSVMAFTNNLPLNFGKLASCPACYHLSSSK